MQPGKLLCDRYRVEKALAAGGFGQTFLAVDTHLPSNPQVVVKLLKPSSNDPATLKIEQRLFNTEAETLERLGKDNDRIPSLYAYFPLQGEFYLVQEYIDGTTFTDELQGRKISESETLLILQEILTGLTKVHSQNIIHRDLKPDNIIRRKIDRKLILIDFGAVKQIRAATVTTPNPAISRTIGIGTEGYMPSEQGLGYPKPASDIYAVGAIAIQCLTGSVPHLLFNENSLSIEWQHLCRVDRDFDRVLNKMVAPDYRQRYTNATEALNAIESLISPPIKQQVKTPPQPVSPSAKPTLGVNTPKLTRIQFASVRLDNKGNIVARPAGGAEIFTEDLGNGVNLTMVKIPAGKFLMGQTKAERWDLIRSYDLTAQELPQHQVNISEFYLGQNLITQAQWLAIMGSNRSWWQAIINPNPSRFKGNDRLPVEQVSWLDAMNFCQKLSQKKKRTYRLPSEAEWEYACRAGTNTSFSFGDKITPTVVNYGGNPYTITENRIFMNKANSVNRFSAKSRNLDKTTPVGSFPPNLFGLYDLHGNLSEWCLDEWADSYNGAPTDGSARKCDSERRLVRGGSWLDRESTCRSANRQSRAMSFRRCDIGFRVGCVSEMTF
jgi:eukaryotic-like serine/threonine-protein kinase